MKMKSSIRTIAGVFICISCTLYAATASDDADTVFADTMVDDTPLNEISVNTPPVDPAPQNAGDLHVAHPDAVARTSYNIPIEVNQTKPHHKPAKRSLSLDSLQGARTRHVASALSVVLGLMLLLAVVNRTMSRRKTKPHELIEVLSRTVVSPKHTLHLVRVHDRMILLAETPNGLAQLESLASPGGDLNHADDATQITGKIQDADAEQLLQLIRSSESWKSPFPDPATNRLREPSHVA